MAFIPGQTVEKESFDVLRCLDEHFGRSGRLNIIRKLRNERVHKNSNVTPVTVIKIINSLVFYYFSILNNVSCNPCFYVRMEDVNCFIISSSSILAKEEWSWSHYNGYLTFYVFDYLSLCLRQFLTVLYIYIYKKYMLILVTNL